MLAKMDLNKRLSKKEYTAEMKELEPRIKALQQKVKALGIPIVIVFEGWSASGKSTHISKLVYPLDPRDFNVHTMAKLSEDSLFRPFLWRYWKYAPAKGRITIYDKSWQRLALPEGAAKWQLTDSERAGFYEDAGAFERQLIDDGCVIVKFFLHISKEEQKKRFTALQVNEATRWRIDEDDWKQNKEYDKNVKLFEEMISSSEGHGVKWTVIEAEDRKYAAAKMYKAFADAMENAAARKENPDEHRRKTPKDAEAPSSELSLSGVNLDMTIADVEYKEKLKYYQSKISSLTYSLYAKRVPVVIVYEGWDAAGKGGNIKRLTQEMDPRGYEVVPVPAPTEDELARHYLWRFWARMPKDGHIAIFDRSWYGRVMVERVEGFASESEWKRAYREINEMERHLTNHGTIVIKFWLNIDKDEQLARFNARQNDPLKQYKITEEDWRNREKWGAYETAVNEMLEKTDTDRAPWVIVPSNDKRYARVFVLEYVCSALERRLSQVPAAAKVFAGGCK
jgi:polyphosphate:AMP phosphotransferase